MSDPAPIPVSDDSYRPVSGLALSGLIVSALFAVLIAASLVVGIAKGNADLLPDRLRPRRGRRASACRLRGTGRSSRPRERASASASPGSAWGSPSSPASVTRLTPCRSAWRSPTQADVFLAGEVRAG